MIGQRFGKLKVVRDSGRRSDNRQIYWECLCDCGETHEVRGDMLRNGTIVQCKTCRYKYTKVRTHGHRSVKNTSGAYKSWTNMKTRCYNKNHVDYPKYGGRGITVYKPWNEFKNFYEDMGDRPEGMTIERKDVNGNYVPENCKWADKPTQGQNRTTTKLNKEKVREIKQLLRENHTNKEIAERYGVSMQCICDIKKGRRWKNVE